jgi:hypothetical protein
MSMDKWYPEKLRVGPDGTKRTFEQMKKVYQKDQKFTYAEFGIYLGDTARNVCEYFPNATVYLFDFDSALDKARIKLAAHADRIKYFPNSQKYCDSYNWPLMKLIETEPFEGLFDFCFLDGAHTVAIDALTFFLCDRLLKVGGYMDFDDYGWRLRGSSLDPAKTPAIALQ